MNTKTKILIVVSAFNLGAAVAAQSNIFPASGDVGIGTTTPTAQLEIRQSNDHARLHINAVGQGATPLIRLQKDSVSKWAFIGEYPQSGKMSFYNYAQDNSIMIFKDNGSVGIGSMDPAAQLEIVGDSDGQRLLLIKESDSSPVGEVARLSRYNNVGGGGTASSALLVLSDHSANIPLHIEDHAGAPLLTVKGSGFVGIGSTEPAHKLDVNGTVRAKEVIVETNWPDYVFDEEYQLMPLREVEQHIAVNGRLPGMPSAEIVADHGISIGEAQRLLLEKVEELTLHVIEQSKRIEAVEAENRRLRLTIENSGQSRSL